MKQIKFTGGFVLCVLLIGIIFPIEFSFAQTSPITVKVATDKTSYAISESVVMTITAVNSSDKDATLSFSSSKQTDYVINGKFRWSSDKNFLTVFTEVNVPARGEYKWTMTHKNSDYSLAIGAHTITGEVVGYGSANVQITVGSATLSITTAFLSSGTVGTSYSATVLASGGSDSYNWSVSSGALPPGLSLGQPVCIAWPCQTPASISGAPTTAGSYTFTIAVKSGTLSASKQFTITIVGSATLSITTAFLSSGTVGTSYSATVLASGGSDSYVWSIASGSLPSGLTLHLPTCSISPCQAPAEISGTPTVAGNYTFTIVVSDGISEASKQFTLNVSPVSPVVKYFRYVIRDDPSESFLDESFLVKMTNSATIQQALDDLNGQRRLMVSGIVKSGNGGFNSPWSWHLDPATVILGESFIEVCDARPSYVETHLVEWLGQRYCPWDARVNAAYDTPPTPGVRPTSTAPVTLTAIQVQTNALNVRQDAALSAAKIGLVRQGEVLTKLEEKNGWVKVQLPSDQIGWVFGQYVTPITTPAILTPGQKVIVTAFVLNVRSGPGVNNKIITTVQRNNVLEKIEEKGGWIRVILTNSQSGWVYGKFVK